MSVSLTVPANSWLALPKTFPTPSGEDRVGWEDRILHGMREAWEGQLDEGAELAVRAALGHGIDRVQPEDSITLQYWPAASIVNAIVHVVVAEVEPGDLRKVVPVDAGPFDIPPFIDLFETEHLGQGVEARYLSTIDTQPPVVLGSVNYLFENDDHFVFVGIDATLPRLVGLLLEPLRDIVRSIEVVREENAAAAPWDRCTVDATRLELSGESWDFGTTAESLAR